MHTCSILQPSQAVRSKKGGKKIIKLEDNRFLASSSVVNLRGEVRKKNNFVLGVREIRNKKEHHWKKQPTTFVAWLSLIIQHENIENIGL